MAPKNPPVKQNDFMALSSRVEELGKFLIANAVDNDKMANGLASALGLPDSSFPFNQGTGWSKTISNTGTIFENLRWYLISNFRQVLNEAYVELGLIQTIVDVPVDDALRGGIEFKSQQLSEDQVLELQTAWDRDDDYSTLGYAGKWNRLFGGAGILVLTDQNPQEPLKIEDIGPDDRVEFRDADLWELYWDLQAANGFNPALENQQSEFFSYYGVKVHRSRVLQLVGRKAPSFIRPRLRGWGFSVVETLVRSINQYLKGTDLAFEVMDEFKLDVYRVKNLTATLMAPDGENRVRRRFALANLMKNYQNALVMDSEDEFDHKQLSFSGLAEAMQGVRSQVASDMRMPFIKLFGQTSGGGLGSTGQDEIEVYNSMVESEVRNKLKYPALRMAEIKCQQLFGFVPDDLMATFKPLRVLTAEQEETVKTQIFNRVIQARQANELTSREFRESINKANLLPVMLDTSDAALDEIEEGQTAALEAQMGDEDEGEEGTDSRADESEDDEVDSVKNWDESKHPRADDGKFGEGGGGSDDGGKPKSRMASIAPSGQITLKKPKTVEQATQLLAEVQWFHDRAMREHNKNPKDHSAAMKAQHAQRQLSRAIALGKKLVSATKNAVKPYTAMQRIDRVLQNSAIFDRKSYEADGGDGWINPKRGEFSWAQAARDKGLWADAQVASQEALGEHRWQFIVWWYEKQGGKFN